MKDKKNNFDINAVLEKITSNGSGYRKRFTKFGNCALARPEKLRAKRIIALEGFSFEAAALISEFIKKRRYAGVGIILLTGFGEMPLLEDKEVLCIKRSAVDSDTINAGVTLSGYYEFLLSSYPDKDEDLFEKVKDYPVFDFSFDSGKIVGKRYFYDTSVLEKELIELSVFTKEFDERSATVSRVISVDYTSPVQNDSYYVDLFCDLKVSDKAEEFRSPLANLLEKNSGILIQMSENEIYNRLLGYVERFMEA